MNTATNTNMKRNALMDLAAGQNTACEELCGPIYNELRVSDDAIETVFKMIEVLGHKINPVLHPEYAEECKTPSSPEELLSPLGEQVRELRKKIGYASARISILSERVGI